jgi:hypothetical protein
MLSMVSRVVSERRTCTLRVALPHLSPCPTAHKPPHPAESIHSFLPELKFLLPGDICCDIQISYGVFYGTLLKFLDHPISDCVITVVPVSLG